ncbi:MAG: FAD-dependent oxidoreductase [Deltaproteobacteria bacterium]|nr:FAD-dependent oxidoreductase [Deltaproteobacteria bacterium]
MAKSDTEVAIIGGGAAGIAAGRRLAKAAIDCLVVEARPRLGGRAWTVTDASGFALDLGCGWLHSADRNPWVPVAQAQGCTVDKTPAPWERRSMPLGFPPAEQEEFAKAMREFFNRVGSPAAQEPDVAASIMLEPGCRWNNLINAVGTFISGAEYDRVSARDFACYDDSGVNWRVREGYGATIAAHGGGLPVLLDCPVLQIDHRGRRLKIETAKGAITADRAIVTLPTAVLADKEFLFTPALPDKIEAARGLPLGLADKLFLSLDKAEEFESGSQLFGHVDRVATAAYYFRPFGRPMIEVYVGGRLAAELEAGGERAFFDFAASELSARLGHQFPRRLKPVHIHRWGADPFSRGSYSYAMPGKADCRAKLAAPVNGRLFFAGEACSPDHFSTAHGGWLTGVAAADLAIAARQRKR